MQKKNDTFSISLENIKNISFDKYDKNFTFIVDGKIYKTSRFYADLISPVVNKYHYDDETINEITIHTIKPNHTNKQEEEKDYFSDFLKLNSFKEQGIDDSHREHYLEYFLQLGNMDEYFRLHTSFFTKITTTNIVDRLLFIYNHPHLNGNEEIVENLLNYAATNFENISNEEKKKLDIDIISLILNNSNLKLKDEDSLLDFVLDMIEIDEKYSVLFEYVMFSNVKYKTLERFTLKFDLDFMNVKIWNKICDRLLLQNNENKQIIQKPKENDYNSVHQDLFYNSHRKRHAITSNRKKWKDEDEYSDSNSGDLLDNAKDSKIRKVVVNLDPKYNVPECYVKFYLSNE